MIIAYQKQYFCKRCKHWEILDQQPISGMDLDCHVCKQPMMLMRLAPMQYDPDKPAMRSIRYDKNDVPHVNLSDVDVTAIEVRRKLQAQNEAFIRENLKSCTQCGIQTYLGPYCDVCDTMYKAVEVQSGLLLAHQEWEIENEKRRKLKSES